MDLKSIQYVLSVAETKSFTQAARQLFISQPALSQYIKKLEASIGVKLFDRDGSAVKLTSAGEVFVQYGHDILAKSSQMLQKIKRMSSDWQSVLRFGMSPFYSKFYLPPIITQFVKSNPNVKLDIVEKISVNLEENVLEGKLDFCFVPELPARAELEYHRICIEEMYVAAPIDYPINEYVITSNGTPCLALKDVRNEPFVHLRREQKFRQMCDAILKNAGFELHNIVCETIGWDTVHIMVASGLGLGIVPELLTHAPYADPRLNYYKISDVKLMRSYAVAYKKNSALDEYAAQIVQLLITYISRQRI